MKSRATGLQKPQPAQIDQVVSRYVVGSAENYANYDPELLRYVVAPLPPIILQQHNTT